MTGDPAQEWGSKPRRQLPQPQTKPLPAQPPPMLPRSRVSSGQQAGVRPSQPPARPRAGCGGLLLTGLAAVALAALILAVLMVGYASAARGLPRPDELQARASHFSSTVLYDRQGGLLNEVGDPDYGRRTVVLLDQIAPYLVDATIATEDPNFYHHPGVDPVGIARALYYAVKERDFSSGPGGSTITQQLVKLTFLSPERTLSRKVKEAILAAEITRTYPRDTILQIYLNEIYYGNLAYGVEAAAETYFDKRASDLTLAEAAMLAGLPQAPAYYDPYTRLWEADGRPGAVKRRQAAVLRLMVENGYIAPAQADAAWQEPIALKPLRQTYVSKYPHFALYVRSETERVLGPALASKGGLHIYTTLDPRVQTIAEEEVTRQIAALADQGATNGAVVVLRPQTGEVLAMVGSADFNNEAIAGQINMALSPRQPGSAIKPFTYLAAFEMPAEVSTDPGQAPPVAALISGESAVSAIEPPGYWTPSTALMDVRTEFPDGANPPFVPSNYDDKEHGLVTVRSALANSYNIPAVKALQHIGLDRFLALLRQVGITTLTRDDYGFSLTLGGGEVTLLELAGAYAVLANDGLRVPLSPVGCVLDGEGKVIWMGQAASAIAACTTAVSGSAPAPAITPEAPQKVLDPRYVYLITSILSDQEARRPAFGATGNLLSLPDRAAAAKTGTSNDYRDAWTMGYTPDLVVGAWVGNADYTPMAKIAGSRGAAPIWHNVMARSLEGQPVRSFIEPPGIQHVTVCADSGTLPGASCPAQRQELFVEGRGPLSAAYDLHQRVRVDRDTGQLAADSTPADRVEERNVIIFPPQYRAWAEAHGYPVLTLSGDKPGDAPSAELMLTGPVDESRLAGFVPVYGRVLAPEPLVWRLEYGVGSGPIGWGVLSGPNSGALEGLIVEWDSGATMAQHGAEDYSLRLAAYEPGNLDRPVAVSNSVHVYVEAPTEEVPTLEPTTTPTPTIPATETPVSTETPVPTETPTPLPAETPVTPTATALPPDAALQAAISEPASGAVVSGAVQVAGIADGAGFAGYQLEYAPASQPDAAWQPLGAPVIQPVPGGLLGTWDTNALSAGVYSLRLSVYDVEGNVVTSQVWVEVAAAN